MTVKGTTATGVLLRLVIGLGRLGTINLNRKVGIQVATITFLGISRGYAWRNILNLVKQFNCETGNGADYKFQQHNNGWGMMLPSWSVRAVGSVGIEGQAKYPTILDATLDRFDWDARRGITGREQNYLAVVQGKGYNPSTNYPSVVSGYNPLESSVFWTAISYPVAIVGALAFKKFIL